MTLLLSFPLFTSLLAPLQEDSLTFQNQLDSLEADILQHREELHHMQVVNNKAQLSKEAAKVTRNSPASGFSTCLFLLRRHKDDSLVINNIAV